MPSDLVTNLGSARHWNFSFPKPQALENLIPELTNNCAKLSAVNGHYFWAQKSTQSSGGFPSAVPLGA